MLDIFAFTGWLAGHVPSVGSTQASPPLTGAVCAATGSVAVTGSDVVTGRAGVGGFSARGCGGKGAGCASQLKPESERCDSNHRQTA